jgi:hypothetical protein
MENQIVIARYNEDIKYLLKYSNISIVYNKGDDNIPLNFNYINLPNIGRESHTYLYHIIKNYDNLANKTLFIQGNINDHKLFPLNDYLYNENDFVGNKSKHHINFLKNHIDHKGKYLKALYNGDLKKSKYTPYEWINLIGIDIQNINDFEMVWGANFSVSKDLIHKKPKIFYENIIKYLEYDKNPEEGHYFERSWNLIFNHSIFLKKKIILYDFFNNNNVNLINKYNILNVDSIQEIHLWNHIPEIHLWNNMDNNIKYICIYPNFTINNNITILLNFKNKKYEFLFEIYKKNIRIMDCDNNIIIENIKMNNHFKKYMIKWENNRLELFDNNNIFHVLLTNNELIDIKSNNEKFINYGRLSGLSGLNIFNMINYYINKNFYRNNFENYYIMSLKDFILENY